MSKRVILTIVGGAVTGGLTAAAGVFATEPGLVAIFAAATGLVGACTAYFGGE